MGWCAVIRLWIDGQEAYEWNSSDKIAWNGTTEWTLTEAQVERLNREADRLDTDVAWWHFVGE